MRHIALWAHCYVILSAAAILDEERSTAAVFQPVPFHYLEIAKVLFAETKECFGADMLKVCTVLLQSCTWSLSIIARN